MLIILIALKRRSQHGYGLMQHITELTQGHVRLGPATLYRSLQRMRAAGLIEELPEPGGSANHRRGGHRREYRITERGVERAKAEVALLRMITEIANDEGLVDVKGQPNGDSGI